MVAHVRLRVAEDGNTEHERPFSGVPSSSNANSHLQVYRKIPGTQVRLHVLPDVPGVIETILQRMSGGTPTVQQRLASQPPEHVQQIAPSIPSFEVEVSTHRAPSPGVPAAFVQFGRITPRPASRTVPRIPLAEFPQDRKS